MARRIDWKNLGFAYKDTGAYVKAEYKNGAWGEVEVCSDPYLNLHVAATCLHYGQACFEGLKVFCGKEGSIAAFRPDENAQRLIDTAHRVVMKPPPKELFLEAVDKVVELNREFVPPYGTGASLYLRPLLIGSSPHVGVHPSEEYIFLVLAMPVGPYYKDGFYPVKAYVQEEFDRAAPHGVGNVKVAGNYAAGMKGDMSGKEKGFPICLYLDSATHSYIDEFGTSNFLAITDDGSRYVTPDSSSVLPSITNKSLQRIARDFGLSVERRPVPVTELERFSEVGACGTAAVITPIYSITHGDKNYTFGREDRAGEMLTRLYKEIQGIQYGEIEDRHGWMREIGACR
ncbi:MAG: branched-chain amino acid aminotransferase [Chitinivibrionales bacterium]|nr:branched-chain amino acid aminotransferase [Chitinivibrionales bacterium]MBD3356172.1 branched-chain amino acid aminotransferase [Chitinivibrionales bacterium]